MPRSLPVLIFVIGQRVPSLLAVSSHARPRDAATLQAVQSTVPGALAVRELDDGRVIALFQMIYTVRLAVDCDEIGYADAYCFSSPELAARAFALWDGDGDPPVGWIRHTSSGRRRPDGDPTREYVAP